MNMCTESFKIIYKIIIFFKKNMGRAGVAIGVKLKENTINYNLKN
jgi:hypothetical protein